MTQGSVLHTLLPMVEKEFPENLPIRYPDFGKRVQEAMDKTKVEVKDIGRKLKVSYEMARRYSLGVAMPRQERLAMLAELLGSTSSYLAFGAEPAPSSGNEPQAAAANEHPHRRVADFELIPADQADGEVGEIEYWDAKGSCGGGFLNYEQLPKGHLVKEASFFHKYGVKPGNLFAIYADGNSMADFIVDGDIVIFDKTRTTPISGKIFLIDHPEGLRIKLLRRGIDGTWTLESKNPDKREFPDERIEPGQEELLKIEGQFVYRQGG